MSASILADRVQARAAEVRLSRMLLTALAALLWLVGWSACVVVTLVVVVLTWSIAAIRVGWADGRGATR